jgi:hypothetical protein
MKIIKEQKATMTYVKCYKTGVVRAANGTPENVFKITTSEINYKFAYT